MKVLRTLHRIYVNDLDSTINFYQSLLGVQVGLRFKLPHLNLELADIGDFLIIAGSEEALKSVRSTVATILVDSVEEFKLHLEELGAKVLRGPNQVPTGKNMTVQHPDGSVMEYVEHELAD